MACVLVRRCRSCGQGGLWSEASLQKEYCVIEPVTPILAFIQYCLSTCFAQAFALQRQQHTREEPGSGYFGVYNLRVGGVGHRLRVPGYLVCW